MRATDSNNRLATDVSTQYLDSPQGRRLAYTHHAGAGPGVLFCAGFNSHMNGDKALALDAWCREQGRQFTRFDYSGHGESSGQFEDGSIGQWLEDTLAILDTVCEGPQLIVGSSMGGWMMLLAALARPQAVRALLGIASAPDFTEALWNRGLDDQQRVSLQETGYCEIPNCYDDGQPYRIGRQLIEEGRSHLLLQDEISLEMPVRLIHGQLDEDVPWGHSLSIAGQLQSRDVEVQLVKSGDHRLSQPEDLDRLIRTLHTLLEQLD